MPHARLIASAALKHDWFRDLPLGIVNEEEQSADIGKLPQPQQEPHAKSVVPIVSAVQESRTSTGVRDMCDEAKMTINAEGQDTGLGSQKSNGEQEPSQKEESHDGRERNDEVETTEGQNIKKGYNTIKGQRTEKEQRSNRAQKNDKTPRFHEGQVFRKGQQLSEGQSSSERLDLGRRVIDKQSKADNSEHDSRANESERQDLQRAFGQPSALNEHDPIAR